MSDLQHDENSQEVKFGSVAMELRWRMHNRKLPLQNRYLRTLRSLGFSDPLSAWVQQHIEWTLEKSAPHEKDSVLVITVDDNGKALMHIDAYTEPEALSKDELIESFGEPGPSAVNSSVLWLALGDEVVLIENEERILSATNSVLFDVVKTVGMKPCVMETLPKWLYSAANNVEAFVVSDEFGVIPSTDSAGEITQRVMGYYKKLLTNLED